MVFDPSQSSVAIVPVTATVTVMTVILAETAQASAPNGSSPTRAASSHPPEKATYNIQTNRKQHYHNKAGCLVFSNIILPCINLCVLGWLLTSSCRGRPGRSQSAALLPRQQQCGGPRSHRQPWHGHQSTGGEGKTYCQSVRGSPDAAHLSAWKKHLLPVC